MNNWDALTPKELNDFRSLLRAWLDLRICSANALAVRAGCSSMTVYHIRNGRGNTTNRTTNEIMQAMGIMERKYIAQWQQQRRKT